MRHSLYLYFVRFPYIIFYFTHLFAIIVDYIQFVTFKKIVHFVIVSLLLFSALRFFVQFN